MAIDCLTASALSAICGKSFGGTNEPTWICGTPAAASARIQSILPAVEKMVAMLCKPSRSPISCTSTSMPSRMGVFLILR